MVHNSLKELLISKRNPTEENESDQTQSFILNDAIKAAGDCGKYQTINLIFLSIVWVMIPSIPIMLPYFRMIPEYICHDIPGDRFCSQEEICDTSINKIKSENSLKTWATDFNLTCEKPLYFGLLGAFYFLGILCGNLYIAKFTDKYGRKSVLICYLIGYLAISLLTFFTYSFYTFFFILFTIGMIYSGTSLCVFVINFESSSKERKSSFSTILSMSYGIGAIFHILVFLYFRNWLVTISISCLSIMIVLMFTYYSLQESPEFLYIKGRNKEMLEVLRYIATVNNKKKSLEDYLRKTNISSDHIILDQETSKDTCGILELITIDDHRSNLIIMCINWFIMTMVFYGINFNVSNFGTNPYATGILVYLSESLAQGTCLYFILNFKFKAIISGAYFISALSLISLEIFLNEINIFGFFLIFIAKFGISAVNVCNYIYTAELFPTEIRVATLSFCSLMSRMGGISGTLLIEVTDYSMIILGVLSMCTILIINKLKKKKF